MHRIFIGFDPRQPISYSVLNLSLISQATEPVAVSPLVLEQLPIKRCGLTPFTFTRFLVPYLCDYEGWALFLDADMLLLDDVTHLFGCADDQYAVMTVDTNPAFEKASLMLFNCSHPDNRKLTPIFVEHCDVPLHKIGWTKHVGVLPSEWNHLVLYDEPREDAKLVHFTGGVPCFPETMGCEYSDHWQQWADMARSSVPWEQLMGKSVHVGRVHASQNRIQIASH